MLAVDLDGTLLQVNTFPFFVRFLLRELIRRRRLRATARLTRALVLRKALRQPHRLLKRTVCIEAERVEGAALERWARSMIARHPEPAAIEMARSWASTTILTTSAPERYAEKFAEALGLSIAHGTRLVDGHLDENVGSRKVERLRAAGMQTVKAALTDDPELDRPLLEMASDGRVVVGGHIVAWERACATHDDGRTAYIVGSLGGHLELLDSLKDALGDRPRTWVTSEGSRAQSLAADGERVRTLPRLDRRSASLASVLSGVRLALAERPGLVLTSGAGLAVPFCLCARALGARLIFLETMARVRGGSATGRLLRWFSEATVVQWPELARHYPGAYVCRPHLLENIARRAGVATGGTFVTLGAHDAPFGRLVAVVAEAAASNVLPKPVVVQTGVTPCAAPDLEAVEFVSPAKFAEMVTDARVVITHGGAGALATAIRHGKRPLVMPRLKGYGEHVDDHQIELVDKLAELALAIPIDGEISAGAVRETESALLTPQAWSRLPSLENELRAIVDRLDRRPANYRS